MIITQFYYTRFEAMCTALSRMMISRRLHMSVQLEGYHFTTPHDPGWFDWGAGM
jgi:hypothetical protein